MTLIETFRREIEAYLISANMGAARFGEQAMNDPTFVSRIRGGRNPSARTMDRVLSWIKKHPVKKKRKAA